MNNHFVERMMVLEMPYQTNIVMTVRQTLASGGDDEEDEIADCGFGVGDGCCANGVESSSRK